MFIYNVTLEFFLVVLKEVLPLPSTSVQALQVCTLWLLYGNGSSTFVQEYSLKELDL